VPWRPRAASSVARQGRDGARSCPSRTHHDGPGSAGLRSHGGTGLRSIVGRAPAAPKERRNVRRGAWGARVRTAQHSESCSGSGVHSQWTAGRLGQLRTGGPPGRAPQTWGPRPCALSVRVLFQTARVHTAACLPDGRVSEGQAGHGVANLNSGRRSTTRRPGGRAHTPRPPPPQRPPAGGVSTAGGAVQAACAWWWWRSDLPAPGCGGAPAPSPQARRALRPVSRTGT
jgi:hypothetical protein